MSNNEPDYEDNLFFNPQTEWKGTALDALGKEHTRFSYRLLQSKIEENAQLKELLKECRDLLSSRKMYGVNTCKTWNILVLIDEVLK